MTRSTKRNLVILSTLFSLCVCCGGIGLWFGSVFSEAIITDPTEVQAVGQEIADYTVPEGYQQIAGFRLMGAKSVSMTNDLMGSGMVITLVQAPPAQGITQAEMERELISITQRFNFQSLDLTFDRVESRVVNGQEVNLTYYIGQDQSGRAYRQMTTLVRSDNGPALIMAQSPETNWDQPALDSLLDSIQ
jgi:hypothetical protein